MRHHGLKDQVTRHDGGMMAMLKEKMIIGGGNLEQGLKRAMLDEDQVKYKGIGFQVIKFSS